MAITLADFTKIWADTSPLTPYSFSESNYKEGWNFVGGTPPARQMWDSIQKQNDEKMKYIVDNFLPLSGGTITGNLEVNGTITQAGKNVGTNNWTVASLTPILTHFIATWGFCRVIYNEVVGIVAVNGLRIDETVTTPKNLFNLPFTAKSAVAGCFFVTSSSPVKIYPFTADASRLQINGITTVETNYIYGFAVIPIA